MIRTSEWVSLGHPDKIADYITSYILDKYLCFDPNVRYALEVMIKNNDVILAGEITSTESFKQNDYEKFVKEALRQIGYDEAYNKNGVIMLLTLIRLMFKHLLVNNLQILHKALIIMVGVTKAFTLDMQVMMVLK